ncbi:hypothetical protein GCM10023339_51740 [Alloalcanivorax gelatiniphagus]|uniref:Acyltransferase family protein n=2 Tax=Alloalcanivorax gelatiniphagus TaxID=1194167 RepID=A0ABY2XJ32_9GAMM|nr:acyltransferase family protein [Alloalcanivorax gelatiniphagus]
MRQVVVGVFIDTSLNIESNNINAIARQSAMGSGGRRRAEQETGGMRFSARSRREPASRKVRSYQEAARRMTVPGRLYFRPEFVGLGDLDPAKPALFVGNHTRYGLLDVPLMLDGLYQHHGLVLRSLGDRAHFAVPGWRSFLERNGVVPGNAANCDALMEAGESILVFPGGAREVFRRRGEEHTLIWKKRLGFVRLALRHGYDIVPFASYGADHCYTVIADGADILERPRLKGYLKKTGMLDLLRGGDVLPPIGKGVASTAIPRPERFYFSFGERISTAGLMDRAGDESTLWQVRERVAESIERQLDHLGEMRGMDRRENWGWVRRRLCPAGLDGDEA